VLGLKLGTLPQWDKKGRKFYVTLVQVSQSTSFLLVIRWNRSFSSSYLEDCR